MLSVLKYKLFANINNKGEQFSFKSQVFRVCAILVSIWIRNQSYETEVIEIVFLITEYWSTRFSFWTTIPESCWHISRNQCKIKRIKVT